MTSLGPCAVQQLERALYVTLAPIIIPHAVSAASFQVVLAQVFAWHNHDLGLLNGARAIGGDVEKTYLPWPSTSRRSISI
jgi:hypothetical protein